MKLMIDMNNNDYEFIKDLRSLIIGGRGNCKTIQYNVINAIKHGTPVSTEGDLISRSELKKAIEQGEGFSWNSLGKDNLCVRKKYIDNAPTVCGNNPKWCESCVSKGKCASTRPQGEWIYTDKEDKKKGYGGYCSVCKCDMPIGMNDWKQEYYESKFCPNCGARMQKGGAK